MKPRTFCCLMLLIFTASAHNFKFIVAEYAQTDITPEDFLNAQFANKVANSTDFIRAIRASLHAYGFHPSIANTKTPETKKPLRRTKRAIKRVCYDELGCFEDSGPFAYLEMLPSPPEEIQTKFFFYSTKNRSDRPLMELPFLNMTESFKKSKKYHAMKSDRRSNNEGNKLYATLESSTAPMRATTKKNTFTKKQMTIDDLQGFDELSVRFIVHGFGSACPHVWIYEMKTALMAVDDCVVICVDWEKGATFPNYVRAAANTRLVGKQLAMLINNLKEYKGLNLTKTHIIGFSLGAHVSGFAGAELPGLARITGLDPAGPLFESQHPKVRLDSTDAEFVDVIHSNGENLILGGLGSWQPMGHVDYYPNGGRVQTGCSNLFVGAVTDFIWSSQTANDEEGRSLCNHRRAYKFFIDSVAPRCMFPAFPCDSYDNFLKGKCFPCTENDEFSINHCGNMGYYADKSVGRGQLYLLTREEEPFCAHQFKLEVYNSFNDLPLRTIGRLDATLEGKAGLNETFKISEKDDSEFFAGDIISKIIVPHPALGYPTTINLQYKSYSGWLSKGLAHWDIDKVVLTDSFGRSHSICKPTTKLSSGNPVHLNLLPGNCVLENQENYGLYTTSVPSLPSTTLPGAKIQENSTLNQSDLVEKRKDIFNYDGNFKLNARNQSFPLENIQESSWQPILETNSLEKEITESSRSLSAQTTEIFEPILKDRRLIVNRGRNLQEFTTTAEIVEPVLKATTPRIKKAKEMTYTENSIATQQGRTTDVSDLKSEISTQTTTITITTATPTEQSSSDTVTVQLFPFRLGDLLQRAERYARETLLPLISIQAPKFFGFNKEHDNQETKEEPRKPRYIPRFEEAAFLRSTKLPETEEKKQQQQQQQQQTTEVATTKISTSTQRNIFDLLLNAHHAKKRRALNDVSYYTNLQLTNARSMKPEAPDYQPTFIELPTYRPPLAVRSVTTP